MREEWGCNFDAAPTPTLYFAGAVSNRWSFPAGGGALTVDFPITSREVVLTSKTAAGGSGLSPVETQVTGTSVTLTPAAADTSTWSVVVA